MANPSRHSRRTAGQGSLHRTACGLAPAVVALAVLGWVPGTLAADKSGVSPNTISLPKGPGSVEGLGESFQPTLNTGTAKYGMALQLPPGTAGHHPELVLSYDGGGANGVLGFGWNLPSPCIQRRTDKGIPTYGQDVGFPRTDTFINESREELVPVANGFFFCKNEGAFVRYQFRGDHWEGTLPDGTRLVFGASSQARIEDPATGRTFCWLLEQKVDTRSNTITHAYASFPGEANARQKYLAQIAYGPGPPHWPNFHFVSFRYEDRPDWFEDCRPGFPVRTGKRLKEIIVGTQGPFLPGHRAGDFSGDGVVDYLNRKYELGYVNYAGPGSHWSLLGSVTPVGADGDSRLPSSTFGYNVCHPSNEVSVAAHVIGGRDEPALVMDSELVDLVDLNGDGLPDVLDTEAFPHTGYLNLGERSEAGADRVIRWAPPQEIDSASGDAWSFDLSAATTHLADMDGDGVADLVHKAGNEVFYFANQSRVSWAERQIMSAAGLPPPAPFGVPWVRIADVDFDKRMDLISGNGLEYEIWFNFGSNQYSAAITTPAVDGFDFDLVQVQMADLNGDRVPDVARVGTTSVEVTAGWGYGRFGPVAGMIIPDFALSGEQAVRARLIDLTGDGMADLVLDWTPDGHLWYWINQGNYTFSSRRS